MSHTFDPNFDNMARAMSNWGPFDSLAQKIAKHLGVSIDSVCIDDGEIKINGEYFGCLDDISGTDESLQFWVESYRKKHMQ